ncbi:MAG: cytochrome P460 family protein [bacterium]
MKRIVIIIGLLFFITFLFCYSSFASEEMPGADPAELWNYITKISPYTQWEFWPDHQGVQPGRAPHGRLHKVYVNDRSLNSSKPPLQYGSIAVKENFDKDMKLQAITVMYKVYNYNPDDGDWFWVKYSPDGKADPYGKPQGCVGCHGTRANNDFVLVHEFK